MTNDPTRATSASEFDGRRRWQQRTLRVLRALLPFGAGIVAVFIGLYLYDLYAPPPESLSMEDVDGRVNQILEEATPAPPFSAEVYNTILPSLVVIRLNDIEPPSEESANRTSPNSVLPVSGALGPGGATEVQGGEPFAVGSGVVINEQGAILTAYHVIEGATTIDVSFADGSESRAELVAVQPDNNIAVLQPDRLPEVLAPATLGNPGALRIGDEAYVAGNPLGLSGSLSAGVISGLDRTYTLSPELPPLERLIQFDTAVNVGSGGGPLLNRRGEVVGIVVGPVNPTTDETFIGIGFAVRIDEASQAAGMPLQ